MYMSKEKAFIALQHAAVADAKHDFDSEHAFDYNLVVESLPKIGNKTLNVIPYVYTSETYKDNDIKNEDQLIQYMFEHSSIRQYLNESDKQQKFWKIILSILNNNKSQNITIDGIKHITGLSSYKVSLLNKDDYGVDDIIRYFKGNTSDKNVNLNFVIDTGGSSLFDFLNQSKTTGTSTINVYNIHNREVMNDAATKSPNKQINKSVIKLKTVYDKNINDTITYTSYNPLILSDKITDKLFCKYNVSLGLGIGGDMGYVKLQLSSGINTLKYDIIGKDNKKSDCAKISKNKTKSQFERSAAFVRKRSGDWLQALSCKYIGRKYKDINGKDYEMKSNAIFTTIDRPAVCYALLQGIDVLYVINIEGDKYIDDYENKGRNKILLFFKRQNTPDDVINLVNNTYNVINMTGGDKESDVQVSKSLIIQREATNAYEALKADKSLRNSYIFQTLQNAYIYNLIGSIQCIESFEDLDYYYYDSLAKLVLAYSVPGDYEHNYKLYYSLIPFGYFQGKGVIGSDKFEATVTDIAKQQAAQSLGYWETELWESIPDRVYDTTAYAKVGSTLSKEFDERTGALVARLQALIIPVSGVSSPPNVTATGVINNNRMSIHTNIMDNNRGMNNMNANMSVYEPPIKQKPVMSRLNARRTRRFRAKNIPYSRPMNKGAFTSAAATRKRRRNNTVNNNLNNAMNNNMRGNNSKYQRTGNFIYGV